MIKNRPSVYSCTIIKKQKNLETISTQIQNTNINFGTCKNIEKEKIKIPDLNLFKQEKEKIIKLKIDAGTCTQIMKPLATDENFTIKQKILIKRFSKEYEINLPIFKDVNVNKNDQIDTNKIKEFLNKVKIKQRNEIENFLELIKFMTYF